MPALARAEASVVTLPRQYGVAFMHGVGVVGTAPTSWTDVFLLPVAHGLDGS